MSHSYPSDITREQFARILPLLESARRRTKPVPWDLYDVFCGVLYLLKSGSQWRMLPASQTGAPATSISGSGASGLPEEEFLERVLKKISWGGPKEQWTDRADQLLNSQITALPRQEGVQAAHRGGQPGAAPCDSRDYRWCY